MKVYFNISFIAILDVCGGLYCEIHMIRYSHIMFAPMRLLCIAQACDTGNVTLLAISCGICIVVAHECFFYLK